MTYWWLAENFTPEGQSTGLYMACHKPANVRVEPQTTAEET